MSGVHSDSSDAELRFHLRSYLEVAGSAAERVNSEVDLDQPAVDTVRVLAATIRRCETGASSGCYPS